MPPASGIDADPRSLGRDKVASRKSLLLLVFLLLPGVPAAESRPAVRQSWQEAVREAAYPISVGAQDELAGTGGRLLAEAIRKAQFVLLGESHFSREIPGLVTAVCRTMKPDSFAVETGPSAAAYISDLLNSSDRQARMQAREREHPASIAFFNDRQENDAAAACAGASRSRHLGLWGLDQEFLGAASVLIAQMQAQPNGPRSTAALSLAAAKERLADSRAKATGDLAQVFLISVGEDDIANLQKAMDQDGTPQSRQIMHEWIASRHIYRLDLAGSHESGAERVRLLKRHFLDDYLTLSRQTPHPRILVKLGDNHLWKGFNDIGELDLGNFIAELASVEEADTIHIRVLGVKGTLASFGGYARPMNQEPFVLSQSSEHHWLQPVVPMLSTTGGNRSDGMLVDLRRLRYRSLEPSADWQRFVFGYDLIILLPELTSADFYR